MAKGKLELLSPAGDYECFLAAIHAGADAVYLGGDKFGARAYAKNFTEEEILKAIAYAHLFDRKVYMTINTILKNEELSELGNYLKSFYLAGLDGVIVQDLGVIAYIRTYFPELPVHASTQMAITDAEGVMLLKQLGIERTVLARELSLSEMKEIHEQTGMELECFIHGALCYCYSGKCLFSSLIGGRSGNRGRCAQPCRLPYNGQYLLSTKDICTLEFFPQLIEAGIFSFKIEGRMKSADYVAGVTGIYRKYFDRCLNEKRNSYQVEKEDLKNLLLLYTRSGNSRGYFYQKNGRDMITMEKPGYQTADEEKKRELFAFYGGTEKKIPVDIKLFLKKGAQAAVFISTENLTLEAKGSMVEEAKNQPLQKSVVEKQMKKTGATSFEVRNCQIEMDEDIFLTIGQLNELRRTALDKIQHSMTDRYRRTAESVLEPSDNQVAGIQESDELPEALEKPMLHCSVTTQEQLRAVLSRDEVECVSIPYSQFSKIDLAALQKSQKKIYMILPGIIRNHFFERKQELKALLKLPIIAGAVVSNYESIYYLKQIQFKKEIIADIHLYAVNTSARKELLSLGVTRTCVPVELNKKELLRRNQKGEELLLYGRLPMMVSAQCIQNTTAGCNHQSKITFLKDRYGVTFPCMNDCSECYNTIWNSVPLSLHGEASFIERLKPHTVRLQFTIETGAQTSEIVDFYVKILSGESSGGLKIPFADFTKGHINRGVE